MKYFLIILLSFSSCEKNTAIDSITVQNNVSKKELLCRKWKLVEIINKDLYTGITHTKVQYFEQYIFNENNTYTYYKNDEGTINTAEGNWGFNEDSTKLGIWYTKLNGNIVGEYSVYDFRWKIEELTDNIFRIFIQGREGGSTYAYIPNDGQ